MLIHHLKFGNVICKNLDTLYLSNNSIDDEGVIALTECLPELFPNLKGFNVNFYDCMNFQKICLSGNLVSEELKLMCNEQLKVLTLYFMIICCIILIHMHADLRGSKGNCIAE